MYLTLNIKVMFVNANSAKYEVHDNDTDYICRRILIIFSSFYRALKNNYCLFTRDTDYGSVKQDDQDFHLFRRRGSYFIENGFNYHSLRFFHWIY